MCTFTQGAKGRFGDLGGGSDIKSWRIRSDSKGLIAHR